MKLSEGNADASVVRSAPLPEASSRIVDDAGREERRGVRCVRSKGALRSAEPGRDCLSGYFGVPDEVDGVEEDEDGMAERGGWRRNAKRRCARSMMVLVSSPVWRKADLQRTRTSAVSSGRSRQPANARLGLKREYDPMILSATPPLLVFQWYSLLISTTCVTLHRHCPVPHSGTDFTGRGVEPSSSEAAIKRMNGVGSDNRARTGNQ